MQMRFLVLLLVLVSYSAVAQDLIIHRNGSQIRCKILSVDSPYISYTMPRVKGKLKLRLSEVKSYEFGQVANAPRTMPSVTVPVLPPAAEFEVSMGLNVPLGDFSSTNVTSEKSGLAKNGFYLQPALRYYLMPGLSAGISYVYQQNGVYQSPLEDWYREHYPGVDWQCEVGNWVAYGLFADVKLQAPVSADKRVWVRVGLALGYPEFKSPSVSVAGNGFGGRLFISQHAAEAKATAVIAGLNLRYQPQSAFAFYAQLNYFAANPSFNNVLVTSSTNPGGTMQQFSQFVQTMQVGLGMSFFFMRTPNHEKPSN